MEHRNYGKSGDTLSIVGVGGVAMVGVDQETANRLAAEAIDRGVNYFDVAPSYGADQEAERRMGPAIAGKRDSVFLACKTAVRTREGAEAELLRSLKHLQTDHFDLYQLHAITTPEDVDTALGPDGALEAVLAARERGQVRHIGFSAHSVEAALAAMERFPFDSALFPLNFASYRKGGFGPQIVEKAGQKGVTCLALKAMARTLWPETGGAAHPFPHCWYEPIADPRLALLALRFALSQPIAAAVAPGDPGLVRLAMDCAEKFTPITAEEERELAGIAQGLKPVFEHSAA